MPMIKINLKLLAFKTNADQTLEEHVFFKVGGPHLFRHKKKYENHNARYIKDITIFL
jgi:membrane-associated PAP2 superfamily phosphatase